jgi:hypothetical protein
MTYPDERIVPVSLVLTVLDLRVYRTAFLPALVALFVAAFALADRPAPARSSLATDAFSGSRAFDSLSGLAAAYPRRPAGSAADFAVADAVARSLRAPAEADGRPGFAITRLYTQGRTATGRGRLETVVGTRVGLSSHRIVVLAHRDGTGPASLSGTAALVELGRVLKSTALQKTLVLVSTSGGTTGFAGARSWAKSEAGQPVDAVIVLGDLAGTHGRRPWVVPWPGDAGAPPLKLLRTVQSAVRTETGRNPGAPRAIAQWLRRAVPVTVSEQGALAGLPGVLLSQSGERGPASDEPVRRTRLQAFGRSALRAVDAIDTAQPALARGPAGVVTLRNVLPDWAVRLVVGSLLLPALLVALDGFFRARRRRVAVLPGLRRLGMVALPVLVAWLWLRLLGATGAIDAPDGPVLPAGFPPHTSGIVAMATAALAAGLTAALVHLATRRARSDPAGLGMATGVLVCGLAALAWVLNPYAAALLIPAAHLWLFAADGWRTPAAVAALVAGLVLPALVVVYYAVALALGPAQLAWGAVLAAAAGAGFGTTLLLAGLLAALAGLIRVIVARRGESARGGPAIRTRGPLTYAGPGSLGGTESALRR